MATRDANPGTSPPVEGTLDFDDETLRAIAEVYKNEGNDESKKEKFSNAIHFYTEGINVNCKDKELIAKLYTNRASAHFNLGNFQGTLNDVKAANELQPSCIEAIERGATACVQLHLYEEAISWCDKGLTINKNNQKLVDLREKVTEETNKVKMNEPECQSVQDQV